MPLEVRQRCVGCHESKERTEFNTKVIGRLPSGKPKRIFSAYCKACMTANPALWDTFGQQARDAK